MSLVIAFIIFGLIVVIHELGHFWVAKLSGMFIEEFAIGMGPKLFGIKLGETLYSLRIFPIGGFCKILGEETQSQDSRAFNNKSVFKRFLVILAGAFMNFLLAFIIFFGLVSFEGTTENKIQKILPGYPAEQVGLLPGDKIIKVNNNKINVTQDMSFYISETNGNEISLQIKRDNKILDFKITPVKENGFYIFGFEKVFRPGLFSKSDLINKKLSLFGAFREAFFMILFCIKLTFVGLIKLISFRLNLQDMSGPIGIVKAIGDTYNASVAESIFAAIKSMLSFTALISANIGVFNLLPLPALDGGKILFLGIEAIRRKPLNSEREGLIHFVGFVLLIILAIAVAISDIIKLI